MVASAFCAFVAADLAYAIEDLISSATLLQVNKLFYTRTLSSCTLTASFSIASFVLNSERTSFRVARLFFLPFLRRERLERED